MSEPARMGPSGCHRLPSSSVRGLLVACVALLGCGEGDPTAADPSLIPGTWDLTGIVSNGVGQTFTVPASEIEADPVVRIFESDATGTEIYQGSSLTFSWSTSGSTLTLNFSGATLVFEYAVNNSTMTLGFDEVDGGDTYRITHTFSRR